MKRPNLFSIATSELSQDAFICWLLNWAKPENKALDENLHACGVELIQKFFEKHGKSFPIEIESVEVDRQDENIDVLCIVNKEFPIIIEDKTSTIQHGTQLADYIAKIEKRIDPLLRTPLYRKEDILPIYFKTYDQSNYKDIENSKYKPFTRADFLVILNNGGDRGINNAIFEDFREHLQGIEKRVQSYQTNKFEAWTSQSWVGFYLKLQQELQQELGVMVSWKKVVNPSGGYMGFTLGWMSDKPYIHLQQDKLCFKIEVSDKTKRKLLRNEWSRRLQDHSKNLGLTFEKPARFGFGNNMTVIVAKNDYRFTSEEGFVDIQGTVRHLREMYAHLQQIQQMDLI